jgi:hypothetical protein
MYGPGVPSTRRPLSSEHAIEERINKAIECETSEERKVELSLFKRFIGSLKTSERKQKRIDYLYSSEVSKRRNIQNVRPSHLPQQD